MTPDPTASVSGIVTALQGHDWPVAVSLVLMLVAWFVRTKAPTLDSHWASFFHSKRGALVLAIVPAVAMIAGQTIAAHGFAWAPLAVAVGVFLMGLLVASNPSMISASASMKDIAPTGLKSSVLALLLAVLAFASGCGPVGKQIGIDIGACAVGQVPSVVASLVPEVTAAMQGSAANWSKEIASLEGQGVDFAVCSVEAAIAALSHPVVASMMMNPAIAIDRGKVYLAQHHVAVSVAP